MRFLSKVVKEADNVFENVVLEVFQKEDKPNEFSYKDAVIMGLLENIINHTKSIIILIDNKHHTSLDSILRTNFENFVYLKFILNDDTERRAKSYMYSNRISEFKMVDKLTEQSTIGRELRESIRASLVQINEMYKSKIDPEERKRIESSFLNDIGMKRLEQKWYNLDGKTNKFKLLCSNMGLRAEYELIYSILSKEVHGKDAVDQLDIKKYLILIKNSNYKSTELHRSLATFHLIELVKQIYKHYGMKNKLRHFNAMLKLHKSY